MILKALTALVLCFAAAFIFKSARERIFPSGRPGFTALVYARDGGAEIAVSSLLRQGSAGAVVVITDGASPVGIERAEILKRRGERGMTMREFAESAGERGCRI